MAKDAKISLPPIYTDNPDDVRRVKQAALDRNESASSFQYRAVMAAVEAHEADKTTTTNDQTGKEE